MNKLKSRVGESLVELLLSMLIISLGMMMLAGAIVTTARLNKKAKEMSMSDETGASHTLPDVSFQVDGSTLENIPLIERDGVYYYEKTTP